MRTDPYADWTGVCVNLSGEDKMCPESRMDRVDRTLVSVLTE
jgi:hypothetical protein